MFGLSFQELFIVGIVAILLFGKRLPEVAKSLGHSYREFRKGLAEFNSNLDLSEMMSSTSTSSYLNSRRSNSSAPARNYDDYEQATAPKFEPPPADETEKVVREGDKAQA